MSDKPTPTQLWTLPEALDEVLRLRAEVERLRAALDAIVQEPLDEHVRIAMETLNTRLWLGNAYGDHQD